MLYSFLVHVPMGKVSEFAGALFGQNLIAKVETVDLDADGEQIVRVQTDDHDGVMNFITDSDQDDLVLTWLEE